MRKYITGFIVGAIVATTLTVYAAPIVSWVAGSGEAMGTAGNPVWVTFQ